MAGETAYFENEHGRIHIDDAIIRQAILPELTRKDRYQPAKGEKGSITISHPEGAVVHISVQMAFCYGLNIKAEAAKLEDDVRRAVEAVTGLSVGEVLVRVEHVLTPSKSAPTEVKSS